MSLSLAPFGVTCAKEGSEYGKLFKRRGHMESHLVTHTDKCPIFSKTFTRKDYMARHLVIYSDERLYTCYECSKTFQRQGHLNQHLITHTDERPYPCPECSKTFKRRGHLNQHLITHTDERPYTGPDCGMDFARKKYVSRHKNLHTDDRPYTCPDCGRRFARKHDMLNHKNTHTGARPYTCPECGGRFTRKHDMLKHKKKHSESSQVDGQQQQWDMVPYQHQQQMTIPQSILMHVPQPPVLQYDMQMTQSKEYHEKALCKTLDNLAITDQIPISGSGIHISSDMYNLSDMYVVWDCPMNAFEGPLMHLPSTQIENSWGEWDIPTTTATTNSNYDLVANLPIHIGSSNIGFSPTSFPK
ncbi:hypothetical protein LZ31DRAFT_511169 [Colletotrichum somersetense]|nr:hypothetical protein LZ31DRAFT_511169 [Colletotrichum somersetense]